MLLFGHIGVTLGVFIGLGILDPQLNTFIDPKYLVFGAILPDLIDKPLGMVIFSSILANGRVIGHTLLFSISILLIGLYLYNERRDVRILSLAAGSFFHLMEDKMWGDPRTLLWPLLGWGFPKDAADRTGLEYLLALFNQSFHLQFSESYIPEILGMGVVAIFTLYWLKNRLDKTNSINKYLKNEDNAKTETKTAAIYIVGFILYGFLFVKAITLL
jgi:hypothetical protein